MEKKYYTTGEIAKITGISQKTIKNYCTQGKIKSEKTPITNYRRISRQNLVRFLEENSIPLDILDGKSGKKVLVTDDDKKIVKLVTEYLKNIDESFIIDTASNGYEACIKAGVLIPDIMILDLNMPKVDGFEVVRNIRTIEETKHARIIICTGYASEENRKTLEEFGVSLIIEKPVKFEEFKKAVSMLTGVEK